MFISHDDLMWMLRRIYGQRYTRETLMHKFSAHTISSLLPYYQGTESLFDGLDDKTGVITQAVSALQARINGPFEGFDAVATDLSYRKLKNLLQPHLVQALALEKSSTLATGTRVMIKPHSSTPQAKPGSEGFITAKSQQTSTVRFYSTTGRFNTDIFSADIADEDLQVLNLGHLLSRHRDLQSCAGYMFNDVLLRVMRGKLNSDIYAFAAEYAIALLVDDGFLRADDDEFVCVLDRIFPTLAPEFDRTYRDRNLFSSRTLSSPPSERKGHVLSLELTTGCDYNRCTFCTEYTQLPVATKSFAEFKEHTDRVAEAIGSAKSGIQRLFIGSGNSLGVATEQLLKSINYAREVFAPQKITLYGRTTSILEKTVTELTMLKEAGLTLIYWGLESGSDEVLDYTHKGCTRDEMISAAQKLTAAGIEISAMLIPGLGGLKFSEQHVVGTLELLHSIDIKYLTLMAINHNHPSSYTTKMQSETDNRHLSPDEVNAQVYELLAGLEPTGLQIGMFTDEIDLVSSNTKRFNTEFNPANKEALLNNFWN